MESTNLFKPGSLVAPRYNIWLASDPERQPNSYNTYIKENQILMFIKHLYYKGNKSFATQLLFESNIVYFQMLVINPLNYHVDRFNDCFYVLNT